MATQNNNQAPRAKGMGREIGKTGTTIFSGNITGEEYNPNLTGKQAIRNYEIMRRSDSTVHATLQVCKLPILSVRWKINPASDNEDDQRKARFIQRELFERNVMFTNFLREGLSSLDFGFAVAEKTYELTDFEGSPMIGIQKIGFRKQVSILKWETDDKKEGVTQLLATGESASIPAAKLIIFTNDKEGDNYEGISLLRYAYKHWHIKDKLDIINAVALEKTGVGVPILKKPANADTAELEAARDVMRNFRANEEAYIEIPIGWEVEMLDMKANTTKEIIPSIQYHDRQIMKSVLAQFLELGSSDASGSRAVSEDHSKLFLLSEEATARNIQNSIQEQLVKQLCDLNFSDMPNGYPKIVFDKIGNDNPKTAAESIEKFVTAGVLTAGAEVEEYIRELLHLPVMTNEAKEMYKIKHEATKNGLNDLDKPADNKASKGKTSNKDDLPEEKEKPDPSKNKKEIEASALEDARKARARLISAVSRV